LLLLLRHHELLKQRKNRRIGTPSWSDWRAIRDWRGIRVGVVCWIWIRIRVAAVSVSTEPMAPMALTATATTATTATTRAATTTTTTTAAAAAAALLADDVDPISECVFVVHRRTFRVQLTNVVTRSRHGS
jgi:hypothetical protein